MRGPFKVKRLIGSYAFELALPYGTGKVHPVYHLSLLEPYHQNEIPGQRSPFCKSTVFYRTPAPIIVYYFPYITCLLYLLFLIKHVRTSG